MSGIMAAALSSATTFLSLVGFSASNDIVRHEQMDERRLLRLTRVSMLGISLIALALAFAVPPKIFWITYFAGTVFASSWGPVACMSVWSRRITADGAFWGIIVGFAGNVVPKALTTFGLIELPVWADPIIIGAILSIAAILVASRRGTVTEAEHSYRARLHELPASELDAAEVRRTLGWSMYLVIGGIAISVIMIVVWVLPFHAARGSNALASGELFMSVGCGLVLILSGLILWWILGRTPVGKPR
jgi:sodium/pantothenate symporter